MALRTARRRLRPIRGLVTGLVAGLAALVVLVLLSPPAAAQQGTPEQRAACENDAMRLCGDYIPDVQRITACMHVKRRYLSPRCRAVFAKRR